MAGSLRFRISDARKGSGNVQWGCVPGLTGGGVVALSVAGECTGAQLQRHGGGQPDLPMGKYTGGNRETAGQIEIRGDAPDGQYGCGECRGREQGGKQKGKASIVLPLPANFAALPETDPNHHGDEIPIYQLLR